MCLKPAKGYISQQLGQTASNLIWLSTLSEHVAEMRVMNGSVDGGVEKHKKVCNNCEHCIACNMQEIELHVKP
jgi:hypothetical protein